MDIEALAEKYAVDAGAIEYRDVDYAPTVLRFMIEDKWRMRVILGPFGSGKTFGCFHHIRDKLIEQTPWRGVRRSRWAVIRNTYNQLEKTTIKTFLEDDVFPHGTYELRQSPTPVAKVRFRLADNTTVEAEILFMAMDRPNAEGDVKGLELTGVYFNELCELQLEHVTTALGRLGRYPKPRKVPKTGAVLYRSAGFWGIADSNYCEEGHWMHRACEEETPSNWKFFQQPGALIETAEGEFVPNHPFAENIVNLDEGYDYYLSAIPGWMLEGGLGRVRAYGCARWAPIQSGKPVFEKSFSRQVHVSKIELRPVAGAQLIVGMDFGLTPAAILMQWAGGHLNVFDEIVGDNIGVEDFMFDFVLPHLANNCPQCKDVVISGDKRGVNRGEGQAKSAFQYIWMAVAKKREEYMEAASTPVFDGHGRVKPPPVVPSITVLPAPNEAQALHEDGRWAMKLGPPANPTLRIDRRCKVLIQALESRYRYRKLQVSGTKKFSDKPEKDEWSHPTEAFLHGVSLLRSRYASVQGAGTRRAPPRRPAVLDAELGF